MMNGLLETGVNSLLLLFVTIDPIGIAPVFGTLAANLSDATRRRVATRAVWLSATILVVFALVGDPLLVALGVGLPAFRIAGGSLLFLLAVEMVFARRSGLRSTTRVELHEAGHRQDISVFPLAFPLLAGPGALTTILLLSSGHRDEPLVLAVVMAMLGLVLVMTWFALLLSGRLLRLLGETGTNVVGRLFGLLLAALAVQFMVDGVIAVLHDAGIG
ncbi:MAG: MarC family protein [Gammaproteobacteria bacterium]|nr:MarC family protein [Gammaproteobacteria bacterium]